VELHVMAQRLQASKRAAAARGELRTPLPVGYVHDALGGVVIAPDAEVQAAISDLFAAFAACGWVYGRGVHGLSVSQLGGARSGMFVLDNPELLALAVDRMVRYPAATS
jgi:DNA invertase Pin-like site-specific DNA recombinase